MLKRFQRLDELSLLKDGWYNGDGIAVTATALAFARAHVVTMPLNLKLYIFPTFDGGILIEYDDTSIEIDADGRIENY